MHSIGVLSTKFSASVIPKINKNLCHVLAGMKQAAATQRGYRGTVLHIPAEARMLRAAKQERAASKSVYTKDIRVEISFLFFKCTSIPFEEILSVVRIGEMNQQIHIIVLLGSIVLFLSAQCTFVGDHKSLFGMGFHCVGPHQPAAFACSISGKHIHVKRPQTERAVISGGIDQRWYFFLAVSADKTAVVFGKSFVFHKKTSQKFTNCLYFWVVVRV